MRLPRLLTVSLLACVSLLVTRPSALSQSSTPSVSDNKVVVLRSEAELWNRGNLAIADQLYGPNYVCHFVAGIEWKGIRELKRQVMMTRTAFPDWSEKIDEIFVEGDRVALRFTSTGTQRGEFEGMAPTGRKVSIREAAFFKVVDGKIVEQWGFANSQALMQQLMAPPKNDR